MRKIHRNKLVKLRLKETAKDWFTNTVVDEGNKPKRCTFNAHLRETVQWKLGRSMVWEGDGGQQVLRGSYWQAGLCGLYPVYPISIHNLRCDQR